LRIAGLCIAETASMVLSPDEMAQQLPVLTEHVGPNGKVTDDGIYAVGQGGKADRRLQVRQWNFRTTKGEQSARISPGFILAASA